MCVSLCQTVVQRTRRLCSGLRCYWAAVVVLYCKIIVCVCVYPAPAPQSPPHNPCRPMAFILVVDRACTEFDDDNDDDDVVLVFMPSHFFSFFVAHIKRIHNNLVFIS